jgi:hypothetical protein
MKHHDPMRRSLLRTAALAGALLAAPTFAAQAVQTSLQIAEDEIAIRRLLVEYGRLLDAGEAEKAAALFAREGQLRDGAERAVGHAELRKMIASAIDATAHGEGAGGFWFVSNALVTVNGADATAVSKFTRVVVTAGKPTRLPLTGHYNDRLVREQGEWRIASREVLHDMPARAAAAN